MENGISYRIEKFVITILIIAFLLLFFMFLTGGITGMVTGVFNTTTTVLQDGQSFATDLNTTTTVNMTTNITTTSVRSGGGGGPSPSPTTIIQTTVITTTTILQIDNDTVVIGNYTCDINDTVDTEVWLSSEAYGAQFTLYYNNSLLELIDVSNGTFFSESYWFNLTNSSSVLYAETLVNRTEDVLNNDVLLNIWFKCLIKGSTDLQLNNVKVVNYFEEYLNISVLSGHISIN
ncbi:hypothetical protein CL614_05025 [archaeon]|nr:hypothetical protein [archaeon]|tara:strand:- start:3851 stop:4549 length:699 start_codon:yes stop_codon:yes gene_type:complete